MIYYSIHKAEAMQHLMTLVSRSRTYWYTAGRIEAKDLSRVLNHLNSKYQLNNDKRKNSYLKSIDEPVWHLVIWFNRKQRNPNKIYQFWLMTTGSSDPDAHEKLIRDENLRCLLSSEKDQMLIFENYVLGQLHIKSKGKSTIEEMVIPERRHKSSMMPIPEHAPSIRSRTDDIDDDTIVDPESNDVNDKHVVTGTSQLDQMIQGIAPVASHGLVTSFKIRWTWFIKQSSMKDWEKRLDQAIILYPKRPMEYEKAMHDIFRHVGFRGVRKQIGILSGRYHRRMRLTYPQTHQNATRPRALGFIRIFAKSYANFKEFHDACITESIKWIKELELQEQHKQNRIVLRKRIRESDVKYKDLTNAQIDEIINQQKFKITEISQQEFAVFLKDNQNMDINLMEMNL